MEMLIDKYQLNPVDFMNETFNNCLLEAFSQCL